MKSAFIALANSERDAYLRSHCPEGQAEVVSGSSPGGLLSVSPLDDLHLAWGGVLAQKAGSTLHEFSFESDFGLLFVNRGTLQVSIDDKPMTVSKGQVLLIRPGEQCKGMMPNASDLLCQWLAFRMDRAPLQISDKVVNVTRLAKVCNPTRIAELFRLLTDEYHTSQTKGQGYSLASGCGVSYLLFSLLCRLNATDPEKPLASNALTVLAERAKDFIRANHESPITPADVAVAMDCSTGYLRKAFRHACGCSPSTYLLQTRLNKARDQLSMTRMPISQVARECGFGSLSYFTRVFTRNEGVTPREYRVTHSHAYTTPGI